MSPSHQLRLAIRQRDRLLNPAPLPDTEVLRIDSWLQQARTDLDRAFAVNEYKRRQQTFAEQFPDAASLVVAIVTFAACLADYFIHQRHLEPLGLVALLLAEITLVLCAWIYVERQDEHDEAEAEARALLDTDDVHQEIMQLLKMRF